MRRNIKLVVSYDGTDFAGWQIQSKDRSVQGVIETALADLHGMPVSLTGAGRTDSGVHATGQVCNFYTEKTIIPENKFRDALNAQLPGDVRILSSIEVQMSFHSRRDALDRQYEYRLIDGEVCPAHLARFAWLVKRIPSVNRLNDMASVVCGTHDYSTFAAAGDASESKIRCINHAVFLSEGPVTMFRINGNAFLWRMVRSLLGTMIDLGSRGGGADRMRGILESRDRNEAGPTAPARGLFLTKVNYGQDTDVH
ncbi:MAG: tRNA pseudouridine(38-40) synthase TruA [Spirochaetaceae bacterium]|nr:tRNA pseudouridine(38-40) synthase TruA [Spirochaetaceae bacterium]